MKITVGARILFASFLIILTGMLYFFGMLRGQDQLSYLLTTSLTNDLAGLRGAETLKQGFVMHDDLLFRYISVGNPTYLEESLQWRDRIAEVLGNRNAMPRSQVVNELLSELEIQSRQYFADADLLVSAYRRSSEIKEPSGWFIMAEREKAKERKEAAQETIKLLSAAGQSRLTQIYSICENLADINRDRMERTQADMQRLLDAGVQRSRTYTLAAGITVLLISLLLAISISGPLKLLMEGVKRVEAGDLSFKIPTAGLDEIGQLTYSYNNMTQNLAQARDRLILESVTDPLTGIFNLRHFHHVLSQEIGRVKRYGGSVSLLIVDVDHFKKLNDTHGHEIGNVVLRQLVDVLKDNTREIDFLARYGGEEFAILLLNVEREEASLIAQKLRQSVADTQFPGMETQPGGRLTVSIGGATFPGDATGDKDIFLKADKALYEAKANGRNRVVWSNPVSHEAPAA